jgi:aminoglycoside phosphotransferase (APT) family kinase protein
MLPSVETLVSRVIPHRRIRHLEPLTGGRINTNLKIEFDDNYPPLVLRLYRDGPSVCRKELALHTLVQSHVPVPKIFHAEPEGVDGSLPFAVLEFVNGITFHELKRTNNLAAISQAAYSVGKTLAAIGRIEFTKPGRLIVDPSTNELTVGDPYVEGPDPIPTMLDRFLESPNCERRLGPELIRRLHDFGWSWSTRLPDLERESNLVHSDFGNRNILVREQQGAWNVAAVIDWEFGFSGSSLLDVGNFLRYETDTNPLREPTFSQAFVEHGGQLPDDWRNVVRVVDLTGLVEVSTHDDLPEEVRFELLGLINATLDHMSDLL